MKKLFRKIREGENKKEYLEDMLLRCWIRVDGRTTIRKYLNSGNLGYFYIGKNNE